MPSSIDPLVLVYACATFTLAGTVKGVIGLGLPTVSLALLSLAVSLPEAMALLLLPSFVTNLWQGLVGGHFLALLQRLWPFLLPATVLVPAGALALHHIDLTWLSAMLGGLLIAYAGLNLAGVRLSIDAAKERWAGPLLGTINGIATGMTGSFVVPGTLFLQAIAGPDDRAPASISEGPEVFAGSLEVDLRGVRVAWAPDLGE